jgi:excinuclease ABC subunit C
MPSTAALLEHVRTHALNRPGVYRMLGPGGQLLYVGRSVRVRERLLSYFRAGPREKAADIVSRARALVWEYLPDEFAAHVRELRLIRRLRPPFNVEHTEDGPYCFMQLTDEEAPRLARAETVGAQARGLYGPFRGRARVEAAVRELSDLLGLCDCPPDTPLRFARPGPPPAAAPALRPGCLRADIQRCLAPCAARCTQAAYLERVDLARRFLEGDAQEPLEQLHARMQAAAARLDFERAAQLRDRAMRLESLRGEMLALHGMGEALSLVYRVPGPGGADRLYLIQRGCVRAHLRAPRSPRERLRVLHRAAALYGRAPGPRGLSALEAAEVLLVAAWFRARPEERRRTVSAARFLEEGLRAPGGAVDCRTGSRRQAPRGPRAGAPDARAPGRGLDWYP